VSDTGHNGVRYTTGPVAMAGEPLATSTPLGHLSATPHVLVADPDLDTRALYREALHVAGYDVLEACDGRDALATALVRAPSLIITETDLPFIDGYTLCALLRHDSNTRSVPIIVVTAEAQSSKLDRARRAGADIVLVKPTAIDVLLNEVQRLLAERTERRARPTRVQEGPLSHGYQRLLTTAPPSSPPELVCPSCDRPLTYERSHVGGVSDRHPEQWDYYSCPASCGMFQYRQRTRKLRRVD
jgi:CheY-like chemotaxis protein